LADYHKAGLLAVRGDGRMLLCRKKHGTQLLILPGGRLEPGETAVACLVREIGEELGPEARVIGLEYVGTYEDRAAGAEATKTVRIELYRGELSGVLVASAEIGELVWFGEGDDRGRLAPSLVNRIIPDLVARGVLEWGS
jgi:8-oxo-dGTP diphosphatase